MTVRFTGRETNWVLINIKARREQNTLHYVEAFRRLEREDPLVYLGNDKSASIRSVTSSEYLDESGLPKWIKLSLVTYNIIDPDAFYNYKEKQDVCIDDWNEDIVANKKEADLYFFPSLHTLTVRKHSKITLKNVVSYLQEALERVERDMFDVSVILDRDELDRITNAYAITSIEATVSFSNPGHTAGFQRVFEGKVEEMNPSELTVIAKGTKETPLNKGNDGLVQTLINMAERDGSLKATFQQAAGAKLENFDSKDHPRIMSVRNFMDSLESTLYSTIRNILNL